jgi:hypothetical protein
VLGFLITIIPWCKSNGTGGFPETSGVSGKLGWSQKLANR